MFGRESRDIPIFGRESRDIPIFGRESRDINRAPRLGLDKLLDPKTALPDEKNITLNL